MPLGGRAGLVLCRVGLARWRVGVVRLLLSAVSVAVCSTPVVVAPLAVDRALGLIPRAREWPVVVHRRGLSRCCWVLSTDQAGQSVGVVDSEQGSLNILESQLFSRTCQEGLPDSLHALR